MTNDEAENTEKRQESSEPDDNTREATPLCPNCLNPVDPLLYYCQACGSTDAVNPLTTYMPLPSLRFQYGGYGKLWRQMMRGRRPAWQTAMLTLILIVAAPIAIPLFVVSAIIYGRSDDEPVRWKVLWTVLAVIAVIILLWLAISYMGPRPFPLRLPPVR
jgi:hypothetical protein